MDISLKYLNFEFGLINNSSKLKYLNFEFDSVYNTPIELYCLNSGLLNFIKEKFCFHIIFEKVFETIESGIYEELITFRNINDINFGFVFDKDKKLYIYINNALTLVKTYTTNISKIILSVKKSLDKIEIYENSTKIKTIVTSATINYEVGYDKISLGKNLKNTKVYRVKITTFKTDTQFLDYIESELNSGLYDKNLYKNSVLKILDYSQKFAFQESSNYDNFWSTVQNFENIVLPAFIFENPNENDYVTAFELREAIEFNNKIYVNDNLEVLYNVEKQFNTSYILNNGTEFYHFYRNYTTNVEGVFYYYIEFASGAKFKSELFKLTQNDFLEISELPYITTKKAELPENYVYLNGGGFFIKYLK